MVSDRWILWIALIAIIILVIVSILSYRSGLYFNAIYSIIGIIYIYKNFVIRTYDFYKNKCDAIQRDKEEELKEKINQTKINLLIKKYLGENEQKSNQLPIMQNKSQNKSQKNSIG